MCLLSREMELATTDETTRMDRLTKPALAAAVLLFVAAAMLKAMAGPSLASLTGITPEVVAQLVTPLIAEAVPREFEGKKDWGKTKKVTTGLRSEGNFFRFDIHSKKSEVNDGIWKKYRVTLIDPDKYLELQIDNMHPLDS